MMKYPTVLFLSLAFLFSAPFMGWSEQEVMLLRDNLKRAQPGDYIVTAQNKNYTMLLVRGKDSDYVSIDEITVPSKRVSEKNFSWRNWIEKKAPGHTCWVMYNIHLSTGTIQQAFSFTRNEWVTVPQTQNFLSTLLNLQLRHIPDSERKRIGPSLSIDRTDNRTLWQPQLIVEGKKIPGIRFSAWKTQWPKDSSELAGRTIEVYLPKDSDKYPSYFPYWLQISGMIGKAKVRIVDSGSKLTSPQLLPQ